MRITLVMFLLVSFACNAQQKRIQIRPFKQFVNNSRDTLVAISKVKYTKDSIYCERLKSDYLNLNNDYERCQKAVEIYKTEISQGA